MRIATWNINSVRARADRAVAWLERTDTDVLALQETKVSDDKFPVSVFEAAGYEVAMFGLNQWNGVAIVSRVGIQDVATSFPGQPTFDGTLEARAIGATCGGIRVWSLYVPHGRALDNPHYEYKLQWLASLRAAAADWIDADPDAQIALLGDWNVIPLDTDVWDVTEFEGHTHVTPPEREAFAAFEQIGYTEMSRVHVPAEHTYTYWDYQQLAFPKNRGMRIDFGYMSPALAPRVVGASIDRNERKGKGASDHVPVLFEIAS